MSKYLTVKAWREANPEKYRAYQRELMRLRRAAGPSVAGPRIPVPGPVAVPAPVLVAGRPCRVDAKTAALLSRGRAIAGTVAGPEPEPEPMTRARWSKMSLEARAYHVKHCTALDSEEAVADWLEALPANVKPHRVRAGLVPGAGGG